MKRLGLVVDEDAERRRMLRTKVKQGVLIAENLKKRLRGSASTTTASSYSESSPTSSLSPSTTISHHDDRK